MNLDNDYDNDGNNIVPCPICLSKHCPSKEDGKCPEEDTFVLECEIRMLLDEYKATGDNSRIANVLEAVDHQLQKTLTSRDTYWKERVKAMRNIIRRMDIEMRDSDAILFYDIYAMAFYDDTGIWPPGKSAPMEMHHEFDQAERSKKFTEWLQALDTLLDNLK